MPDPTRATVSASQIPALFGQSPWVTPWQLFQHFKDGRSIEKAEDELMGWGKRLEPVVLDWARDELRIDLKPNIDPATGKQRYLRHPSLPVGCTADGFAREQRGLIVVETKCVSVRQWVSTWANGAHVPVHYEVQHQTQLMVPDPEFGMPVAGFIVVLVGGCETVVYERKPEPQLHEEIAGAAVEFLADVKAGREPPIIGTVAELKLLADLYPPPLKAEPRDLRGDPGEGKLADYIARYRWASEQRAFFDVQERDFKAQIIAAAEDHSGVRVSGYLAKVTKSSIAARTQEVKAHVQTRLTVSEIKGETPVDIGEGVATPIMGG